MRSIGLFTGWSWYWDERDNEAFLEDGCTKLATAWMAGQPSLERAVITYGGLDEFFMEKRYMEFARNHVEGTDNLNAVITLQSASDEETIESFEDYNPDPFDSHDKPFTDPPSGPAYFTPGFSSSDVVVYHLM